MCLQCFISESKLCYFWGLGESITTGIPRINELVNHSQSKVRQIYGALEINDDEEIALQTKAKLEKTLLGSICRYIKTVYRRQKRYIEILLDKDKMRALRIRLNVIIFSRQNFCTTLLEAQKLMVGLAFIQSKVTGKSTSKLKDRTYVIKWNIGMHCLDLSSVHLQ